VGYTIDNTKYWVATSRHDLTGIQIAHIYKLRWDIAIFFGWWKRHLRVYHQNKSGFWGKKDFRPFQLRGEITKANGN